MTTITILIEPGSSYTVRVRGGDLFPDVIEELKERIPSRYRKYTPHAKAWVISSRYYLDEWISEVGEWCGVDVEWERTYDEPPRYQAPPPPPPPPPRLSPRESALATLHLLPSAPPEVVKAAHKAMAMIHHPDRGGDVERMKAVNNAFDVLKVA